MKEKATDVINSDFSKVVDGIVIILFVKLSQKASTVHINYLHLKY